VSSTPVLAPAALPRTAPPQERRRTSGSLRRALAILVLPASIVPVFFIGPTLLRSPERLARQASAAIQRLEGLPMRHGPLPPILAPLDSPEALSPAIRHGLGAGVNVRLPR